MARRKLIVSYLQASKGRGAVDIDAQRGANLQFAQSNGYHVVEEFVERGSDRRVETLGHRLRLSAAVKRARKDDCPILVASLQSLSQDVRSIGDLVAQRTSFIVAGDHPFTLRLYPTLTDEERALRGQRIRKGQALARTKGARFGNPTNLGEAGEKGREAHAAQADRFAAKIRPTIENIRASGVTSHNAIAKELNRRGVKTARDHLWAAMTVRRVVERGERFSHPSRSNG